MSTLKECILSQVKMDSASIDTIVSKFQKDSLKKGANLLESGSVSKEMAFIESGYMRLFTVAQGNEVTLWIGKSGQFISSVPSFVFKTPSNWAIQAITPCSIQILQREKHQELCSTVPKWLEFDNLLLANAFMILENRMFAHLHTTAQERLTLLMTNESDMFKYVPLQYIASMLGITPVSLSRLRKKLLSQVKNKQSL